MSEKNNKLSILDVLSAINQSELDSAKESPTDNSFQFRDEDLIDGSNVITKLVRYYFLANGITEKKFKNMCRNYYSEIGMCSSATNTKINNSVKTLKDNKPITWYILTTSLLPVLGLTIEDVSFTTVNKKTGEIVTFSLKDVNERIKRAFPEHVEGAIDCQLSVRDRIGDVHIMKGNQ